MNVPVREQVPVVTSTELRGFFVGYRKAISRLFRETPEDVPWFLLGLLLLPLIYVWLLIWRLPNIANGSDTPTPEGTAQTKANSAKVQTLTSGLRPMYHHRTRPNQRTC